MTSIRPLQRMPTRVPGLDTVLGGGLFESGLYIVQGCAGAGKTILANQICFNQCAQEGRAIYYTLLTESHARILGFLQSMSFFNSAAVASCLNYVSGFKVLDTEGLTGVIRHVREVVTRERPALLAIDGVVSAEEIAPDDIAYKKFLHELQTVAAMFRCTILLLLNTEGSERLHAQHTMVDGIIELRSETVRLKPRRSLEVPKMRGSNQLRGTHSFEITGDGIEVRQRVEALLQPQGYRRRPTPYEERCGFGVDTLDAMLSGGLPKSSNTMMLGPSGAAKTILGMHFLDAGLARGERALLFTFYERPEELLAKARRLRMHALARGIEDGRVKVVWQSSVEANIDTIGNNLIDGFGCVKPARVFLDGMHGFQATLDAPERIQDFFAAISDFFISEAATLLFSSETEDVLGAPLRPPFVNASRMCHNIIVLRYAEIRGRVARALAIFKMRDSGFDPSLREFHVEDTGVTVGAALDDVEMVLLGQPRSSSE